MLFYDFEVFKYDWLVVILDMIRKEEHILVNDLEKLKEIYEKNVDNIWIGYNSRGYDQYILKGLLCGFNPKEINDFIIVKENPGWKYSSVMQNIPLINYDVMMFNDGGLKSLEGFMGHDIKETSVPFDIDRKLTKEEIEETIKYCKHDVEQTVEVFLNRKEEFEAALELTKIFGLPLGYIGKTKAQLVAEILGGTKRQFDDDEFSFPIVPCVEEHLKKYRFVLDWYKNPENHDYEKSLETIIAGVPHTFAWGGLHGAKNQNVESGVLLNMDVTAYYPSIQRQYKFGYRTMSKPENFEKIYKNNLEYKKAGNDKARYPFKIAINSISGQLKDKYSRLYDPMMNNAVCVNGQLMLLLLIEMVEPYATLIQSNTDGILIKLKDIDDYELIDDVVYEWEKLTGMQMEFELFEKIFQKDVNNYILVDVNGKIKTKGAYVKKLSALDYNLPIVNKALIDYMVHGVPVEDTIMNCDDLKEFQMIVKISSKYEHILYGDEILKEKCVRIFASKLESNMGIRKVHASTGTSEKIPNSPEHCFICNDNINGKKVPKILDKQWYIDLAEKRLSDFGVM